ncbi:MAG: RluA family pseudouridine synthase [Elusimicrobia bacterium]|nr:RluA family pseudouridine synthase [Elusimicrobiota bacterium]
MDQFLKENLETFSRNQIQKWIAGGHILCDDKPVPSSHALKEGETILGALPEEEISILPELIPLDILHEDRSILAVHKPAGMVTHPAVGNFRGTLANGIAYHLKKSKNKGNRDAKDPIPSRLGLAHRLDRDTSGVIVIAKSAAALENLSRQFRDRTVEKVYRAIVCGQVSVQSGQIDGAIEQGYRSRKMVLSASGKSSRTDFKVLKRFPHHTYLEVFPKTGRTHQIRVHLSQIGYPVLGDKLYGTITDTTGRQMLHAYQLTIRHPATKKKMVFTAPLPEDFQKILKSLSDK